MRRKRENLPKSYGETIVFPDNGTESISLDQPWRELTKKELKERTLQQIRGRGHHMCQVFELIKDHLDWNLLARAQTASDIRSAFTPAAMVYRTTLAVSDEFLLLAVQEKSFPKTLRGRVGFLGRSCANWGRTSPRRSRDLFEEAERLAKTPPPKGRILRQEYYIVCSCSYEGPAFHGACPRCSAKVRSVR